MPATGSPSRFRAILPDMETASVLCVPVPDFSEESFLGERYRLRPANDDVIQDAHVDEREGVLEPFGHRFVGLAGIRYRAWMIMGKEYGGCVMVNHSFDHFSGMDGTAVYRSPEELLEGDHPMPVVQENHREHLAL